QTDASVNFLARGVGYTMFLKPDEAVFVMARQSGAGQAREDVGRERAAKETGDKQTAHAAARGQSAPAAAEPTVLRMKLVGARAGATVEGMEELAGKVNYFNGNDPAKWRANVPTYGRVRYKEIYPGVDVVYYGNQRQLEYDFVVAPGSDARNVSLKFEGADKVEVDEGGDLLLTVGDEVVRQLKPVVYQEVAGGARREVESGYELRPDGRVGFHVGEYDAGRPLVIDPILVYSTYLGGGGTEDGNDIKVDSAGNAYICGNTSSTNFPTANPFQATFGGANFEGGRDGFITKLNSAGSGYVYSTYFGGSGDDRCNKIAIDSAGNAYVAGETTSSTNFPRANAYQNTFGGGLSDAFVTKLDPEGDALVYSTYLGGSIFDSGNGIALDSSNNAYITGRTTSADFPTTANAIQETQASQFADAYVTKLDPEGDALVYSTYLGGSGGEAFDAGFSIAVDSAGAAYVTGQTTSTNFPTINAVQAAFGGGSPDGDAFVTKINAGGDALAYSTYLGGNANDIGFEIAVDSANSAYVTGVVRSANFPTANAYQAALNGASDAFLTKYHPNGTSYVYSTYFGGSGEDSGNGIAVNAANEPYVAGGTTSTNLPTANATQAASGGGVDAFITRFNAGGSALIYSTYLGGSGGEAALAIALDSALSMYVAGRTTSTDFPTLTAVQNANGGGQDGFVTKLSLDPTPTPTPTATATPIPTPVVQFAQATYTVAEGMESNTDPASLTVTVTRTGNTTGATTVEYRTVDLPDAVRCDTANGTAYHRCDYATTLGTLSFAAGETSKTVAVFITNDAHVEGNETFQIALFNAVGASLGTQGMTTVTIQDNDAQASAPNPIDASEFFIRQHYVDFLARAPEPAGFAEWVAALNGCGAGSGDRGRNPSCDRVMVSSGFFRSDEFLQVKGYFAYRFYEVAFGHRPTYQQFTRDLQRLTGSTPQDTLARQAAYTIEFTERQAFRDTYPESMTLGAYVDALFNTGEIGDRQSITRQDNATLTRAQLADGSRTRAAILREIVESREVSAIFYNRAFVAAQYFGYLRRDPESPGYEQWLTYLNANPSDFRTMVNGFVNSVEYRLRFGNPN
ncbi:MAG TPA: SBBP repeat-containing protein, partial [Pyrinomonadaceae bacterium]|nr:SBBP repeat-containing protein [Pyrinomonadaceae bacterium]